MTKQGTIYPGIKAKFVATQNNHSLDTIEPNQPLVILTIISSNESGTALLGFVKYQIHLSNPEVAACLFLQHL